MKKLVLRLRDWPPSAWIFFAWLVTLSVLPFLIILAMSFAVRSESGLISWTFTLANYERAFHLVYLKVLAKTIFLSLGATITCLLVGFPVAYYLARATPEKRQMGLMLLFIPFWTNFILRIYGIVSIFGNHGLLNQTIMRLGLTDAPLEILYTRFGIYLGLVYNYLPFIVVPIFSALEKFDLSLREAAMDLGANRWQTFTRVLLPNVREGIAIGSLFVFIPMMGEYVIPDILGGAKEVFLGRVMVEQFFTMQDWPFGSALASVLSMGLMIAVWVRMRFEQRKAGPTSHALR
jgi:spermidine/putrescine transport system permease protein